MTDFGSTSIIDSYRPVGADWGLGAALEHLLAAARSGPYRGSGPNGTLCAMICWIALPDVTDRLPHSGRGVTRSMQSLAVAVYGRARPRAGNALNRAASAAVGRTIRPLGPDLVGELTRPGKTGN